ncbi:hypothetical protein GGI26_002178 [Coemansia sp. RSA 1358]|nr:hypothetical protein EDC05_000597 [Coemansia umbellata]KAJ2623731.1 hypothetical protein GGI26_002178 [Coemansia sp. RSA 1358]
MTGPTKPFDPFGTSAPLAAASESKAQGNNNFSTSTSNPQQHPSPENSSTIPLGSVMQQGSHSSSASSLTSPTSSAGVPTKFMTVANTSDIQPPAASAALAAPLASPAVHGLASTQQARHTSIFELGGEPFSENSASPAASSSQRLSRVIGASNGGASISSTTSPISLRPLGTIMGSPHSLFNDAAYAGSTPSQIKPLPHRLSQSRFNNVLGDVGIGSSGIGRGNESDIGSGSIAGGTIPNLFDTSTSMLDNIKSQQASPNASAQPAFNDFYVKSLPVSRRNSREFQNLWQELEGFSINDSVSRPVNLTGGLPSHLSAIDGHAIAARNSSGAFRGDTLANPASFGTSPKLPQGLLDDDVLTVRATKTTNDSIGADGKAHKNGGVSTLAAGGMVNGLSLNSGNATIPSGTDTPSTAFYGDGQQHKQQIGYPGFSRDSRLANLGGFPTSTSALNAMNNQQQQQQHPNNSANIEALHNGTATHDLRHYDPNRGVNLIRNASTPVLNTKQYQVMQKIDDLPHAHMPLHTAGPPNAALADPANGSRLDNSTIAYNPQFHGYPVLAGDLAYDAAGGRAQHGPSNYPYSAAAPGITIGRNHSFIAGASASGTSTPIVNGYGMQGPFGPSGPSIHGIYGTNQQGAQPSVPHTPLQQPQYTSSHVQPPSHSQQQQQQQQLSQNSKGQPQRHSQLQQPPHANAPSGQNAAVAVPANPSTAGTHHQGQSHSHSSHHHQKHAQNSKAHRKTDAESNRFTNMTLDDLKGSMLEVCKDQHGCRFLQKKLEERQEDQIALIFTEVLPYFSVLMTDPFGNYLCQKMLEYCTEPQRTQIVVCVAPELVNISLNMHGTRAVQKMIESLSCQEQTDTISNALKDSVVMLIRDLNGNHVIQKCLGRLSRRNNQFIYDSVAKSCLDVATHRHGCCVFQRCIDYASDEQKSQLVKVVIAQALALVQDPFGNYVVQYVLDLGVSDYSEPLIKMFVNHICGLSVQKFSSNVMEKCIRLAGLDTRKQLIAPLMQRDKLEMLMRDSYGNYVVQTALDFSDPQQRADLIEAIVPLLALIRHTPYGKRIYIKLQRDGFVSAVPSAAGSRHASPILGPSHGTHPTTAISSLSLYPQMVAPGMPLPSSSGSIMPTTVPVSSAGTSAGLSLSRGVSPSGGGAVSSVNCGVNGKPQRTFAQGPGGRISGGPFDGQAHHQPQQMHQPHPGAMYYYNMAGMDGAASAQLYHTGVTSFTPTHPGSMAPATTNGAFDGHHLPISSSTPAPSTAAAAGGSSGPSTHPSLYYGGDMR